MLTCLKASGAHLSRKTPAHPQIEAELLALEGAPSVSAALRALRESPVSDVPAPVGAVRAAAEILLAYVVNALREPRDPRVHRVKCGNPIFQRALGRLGGCEGAMAAVGFEPRDRGTVFVLRCIGVGVEGRRENDGGKGGTARRDVGEVSHVVVCNRWRILCLAVGRTRSMQISTCKYFRDYEGWRSKCACFFPGSKPQDCRQDRLLLLLDENLL